ncbi:4'-phosphopantetheinyl transferase family protein [Streptomyces sp. WI04-05B]|uniref:4'-phosphopantetheinyl transferase family protein n=1 Tax=Streptomyces TaxID=1883 RepID=UPI0029B638F8|nr:MULTISPECIES: 4'-phosphopantetheinyl transferase superfamily protein [unclassified Streptomyces]MDX2547086.1 4'-phosphopantetheinyl transferase superfamily protein [Streptomyces sp. WI04-05B]MDX2589775.1 4'-phosphopantetheinyl transferase superfamily protein [Streptomyces sp. WI04-05A]MDX3753224.1 4'-phosphopantetheinyl transferase superfamily protein [Streptomyces sp. AK08-02]
MRAAASWLTVLWGRVPEGDERRATHAALVAAAARLTGRPAGLIRLAYDPGGRPRLTGPAADLKVSLSHAGGVSAVALGRGPAELGIDIEPLRPLPAAALARRWLDVAAAEWLTALPEHQHPEAFLTLWTRKEALGKARGHGLRAGGLHHPVPLPTLWPPTARLHLPPRPGAPTTTVAMVGTTRAVVSVALE